MGDVLKGVLLLNLGGPDTLEAVKPFLYNLFSDRDIIRLGPSFLQKPLAWLISSLRTKKTQAAYALIGGGSPILKITQQQARLLQEALKSYGDFKIYIGMRYWHPLISDTVKTMYDEGIRDCIVLSLYPHYSMATTGSAYKEAERYLDAYQINCVFAGPWYNNASYIGALYDSVTEAIDKKEMEVDILYSAHSLPESFIENGDPYVDHIRKTISLVNDTLKENGYRFRSHIAYQSRSGPVRWLAPSTDDKILEITRQGIKELIVVPISFISDHIETLYEIDILYRELASEHGLKLRRAVSMNTRPAFIETLKSIVLKYDKKGN